MRNLKLSLRTLGRTPFVTAVAALSLGLGIGANSAIYSIFYRMVRQELPVRGADRLVNFSAPGPKNGSTSCGQAGSCDDVFSYPMFRDLQNAKLSAFTAIAGHRDIGANVSYGQSAFARRGYLVSGSYFPILQIRPALGRLLSPPDDAVGAPPAIVLAYWFWETNLGADPGAIGKTLTVNGRPGTIVGVAPKDFNGTTYGSRPAFYATLAMGPVIGRDIESRIDDRRAYWIYVFARLAAGATIEQARSQVNSVYQPIIRGVEAPLQRNMRDSVMKRFLAKRVVIEPGARGQSDMAHGAAPALFMLFAITGLVLLIACANVANLLMARATSRELEMAIRLSLGATRRQLLAQLLTETMTLAVIGGVLSLAFASWTLQGVSALLPQQITEDLALGMNWAAVGFAALLSLVTGIAFGLFPALHSTRPDLVTALRNNSGKLAGGRTARRFRTTLATAQIALAMALLMSAGLFLKSLWKVERVDLGVRVENLVTFSVTPSRTGYDSVRARTLYTRIEQELAALPGASAVTSAMVPLIAGSNWNTSIRVQGYQPDAQDSKANSSFNAVGSNHFRAIGVPLLAGREFTDADDAGAPKVAIVNETFARRFGLGANPVGKRMAIGSSDTLPLNIEIVGLVRDMKYSSVKSEIPPVYFTPHRQSSNVSSMYFYVRTASSPSTMLRSMRSVVQRLDPMLPVEDLRTMPEEIRINTFQDRMITTLAAAFALLATLLASIGLYGVLAYSTAQRTREIGVRMALGANAGDVRLLVLRQVGLMTAVGGVIGLAGALALGRGAQAMLYEMSGADPLVMVCSVIFLALVAFAAGYVPALRASRVSPIQALRYE
ncbi:MAG TPA: ABC transporter permease [Gemmatimonadaceae bacterium]|nr:ABC transporter permease [Gemmatimonadaceae bacterium]